MDQRILPIDTSPYDLFILTPDGHAVWPVRTADERRALEQITDLFAARLEETRGYPGQAETNYEEVVGLGEEVRNAARLYAHLTNRRFSFACDLGELAKDSLPSVVVTTPSWLSNELFERLYAGKSDAPATGIICAATAEALHRQVLIRAAAAVLCGPVETARIDVYPLLSFSQLGVTGLEILGGKTAGGDLRAALGKGAGVLTIQTHSDGVDAFLGADLTLCPMDAKAPGANDALKPRCQITGMCHRLDLISIKEGLKSGALLSPDEISARIFIWNTCFGLLPPDGVVDPAWGLGQRLLDSAALGAVLTTWEIVITEAWHTEGLAQALLQGLPVGVALNQFNRSRAARRFGRHRMCLLGDPRVRLPTEMGSGAEDEQKRKPRRVRLPIRIQRGLPGLQAEDAESVKAASSDNHCDLAFLKECLVQMVSGAPEAPSSTAAKALDALLAYERAIADQSCLEETASAPGPTMRRALLQYIFRRGKLLEGWLSLAKGYRAVKAPSPCFVCGRRTNTTIASFHLPGVSARRLSICPRCGIIEDVPHKSDITVSLIDENTVRVNGWLPGERWTAGALLKSPSSADNIGWEWPADSDGAPARIFQIPKPWPSGPLRLSFILLWDEKFAIISQMARGVESLD